MGAGKSLHQMGYGGKNSRGVLYQDVKKGE